MTQAEAYRAMAYELGAERAEPEVTVEALKARLRERREALAKVEELSRPTEKMTIDTETVKRWISLAVASRERESSR